MTKTEKRQIGNLPELRNYSDGRSIIIGRVLAFNTKQNCGAYDEIISDRALQNCDMTDVPLLLNHNREIIPFARFKRFSRENTMNLIIDSEGLSIKAWLDAENNPRASALVSAVIRGDVTGLSYTMLVGEDAWQMQNNGRQLRAIKSILRIYDISISSDGKDSGLTVEEKSKTDSQQTIRRAINPYRSI